MKLLRDSTILLIPATDRFLGFLINFKRIEEIKTIPQRVFKNWFNNLLKMIFGIPK